MAMFPCSIGNHRYQGPQQSAYLGAVNGTSNNRSKQRLCPEHFAGLVEWLDDCLVEIDINDPPSGGGADSQRPCFRCSGTDTRWALFANVYPNKQEPRVWFGNSCAEDIHEFLAEMGIAP